MNKVRLNQTFLNAVSLNGAGLHGKKDAPQVTWEDYIANGYDILVVKNAKANSIASLTVDGVTQLHGTLAPEAPLKFKCNKGYISYGVLGRNLLEVKDENIVVGKYINNSGAITSSTANMYFQRFVSVKPSTAYTLSTSEGLNYANFMEYDANGVFLKRTLYGSSSAYVGTSVIHTMGADTAFVIVGSNVNSAKYPEITKEDVKAIKWMFCEGSTVKAYEAYRAGYSYDGESIVSIDGGASATLSALLGVGDYSDKQDIISGVITRKVGIRVFDGSEDSWYLSMSGDVYRYRYKFDDDDNAQYKNGRGTDMACTHFKVLASGSTEGGAFLNGSSNSEYLFLIPDQSITTLEDFRQWLHLQYAKGTPVMVTYPLAEETTENVAPQPMSNPSGEVVIRNISKVVGFRMEATLKIKGNGGGEITFTVDGVEYKALEGMTWYDFYESEYNVDGFWTNTNEYVYVRTEGDDPFMTTDLFLYDEDLSVMPMGQDVIVAGRAYGTTPY